MSTPTARAYLDFLSGLAVTSLGHAHPVVAEAVAEQARTLSHVSNLFGNTVGPEVAVTLDRLVGGGTERAGGQVFFANSGAEANECALKLARRWAGPGRHVVVSTWDAFHGRTLATLTATGQPEKQLPFLPLPEGFDHVPYDDLDALDEPPATRPRWPPCWSSRIQGEAGVVVPSSDYLVGRPPAVHASANILLMVDEVQTGLGRTGRWFGFQHLGIEPDVVTMAKALGNGMPVGACWARAEVAAAFVPGDHGSTFGGQPLAMAAARATLAVMEAEDVPARARVRAPACGPGWRSSPAWSSVRGAGLLLAAVLDRAGGQGRLPAGALADGLVVNAPRPDALRFAPSLLVSDDEIDEAVAIVSGSSSRWWPTGPAAGARHEGGEGRDAARPARGRLRPGPATCSTSTTSAPTAWPRCWRWPSGIPPGSAGPGRTGCGPGLREAVGPHPQLAPRWPWSALGGHPVYIQGPEVGHRRAGVGRGRGPHPGLLPRRPVRPGRRPRLAGADGGRPRRRGRAPCPVVNLLSDRAHPCQALADLLTLRQVFGPDGGGRPDPGLRRRRQQRVALAGPGRGDGRAWPTRVASPGGVRPDRARTSPWCARSEAT